MAVYFIKDAATGLVKIGHTAGDVRRRVASMQTGSASELSLLGVLPGGALTEAHFHQHFAGLRRRGEWFEPTGPLGALVATLQPPPPPKRKNDTSGFWNGLTSQEVSDATGLSKQMVCEIRGGKRKPSPRHAIALQRACGVSAVKLVFGDLAAEAR